MSDSGLRSSSSLVERIFTVFGVSNTGTSAFDTTDVPVV